MVRAATAPLTPGVTQADLAGLAQEAGLDLVEGADLHALASEVTEALRRYALFYRMDHANAGAGEVDQWAKALTRWAAEGLVLLGGTLDQDSEARGFPSPHSVTVMRLADAWPAFEVPLDLEYLLHRAAGHSLFPDEERDRPGLHDVIRCCAAAAELIHRLASSLEEKAAAPPHETRPTEYARRELVRNLAKAFELLHGRALTVVRSAGHAKGGPNRRDNHAGGRALRWVHGLLNLVSERGDDPVMKELADWAMRPDAVAEVVREIRRNRNKIIH